MRLFFVVNGSSRGKKKNPRVRRKKRGASPGTTMRLVDAVKKYLAATVELRVRHFD